MGWEGGDEDGGECSRCEKMEMKMVMADKEERGDGDRDGDRDGEFGGGDRWVLVS